MKIYLAGSCGSEQRSLMVKVANTLRNYNQEVYCPFELKIENAWDMSQEEWSKKVFDADVAAIRACDIFFMVTPGRNSTAGTNWEQGYAYALHKQIIVVQYTNDSTSLMTYSSADQFIQIDSTKDICNTVIYALNSPRKGPCNTNLT